MSRPNIVTGNHGYSSGLRTIFIYENVRTLTGPAICVRRRLSGAREVSAEVVGHAHGGVPLRLLLGVVEKLGRTAWITRGEYRKARMAIRRAYRAAGGTSEVKWFAVCDVAADEAWVTSRGGAPFPATGGWTYQDLRGTVLYEGDSETEAKAAVEAWQNSGRLVSAGGAS